MINDGYIEEPRFFEPYNPLRNNYIPKFYYSSEDLNRNQSTTSHSSQTIICLLPHFLHKKSNSKSTKEI